MFTIKPNTGGVREGKDRDRLRATARLLGHRLNRRDFVGTMGKGALVIAAALTGLDAFRVKPVLAFSCPPECCNGCIGECTCGPYYSSCTYSYAFWTTQGELIQRSQLCAINCRNSSGYECCYVYVPSGTYSPYSCSCNAYDCTGGCGSGGPC